VAVALVLVAPYATRSARGSDSSDTDQTDTERPERPPGKERKENDKARRQSLEDTATEHLRIEMAGYKDTDHITVLTPSIQLGIENVSGASLSASYLVDMVSAASADIVSTASQTPSNRWGEVRQASTLSAQYKPHDFGIAVGGSVSSEPDYLSYGTYFVVTKDFDEKNWTLTFGYGFSHDTAGRCGVNGSCTPFSVFSRELQRGSFNGGIAWVVDRATLASASMDIIIENGDQSKPYRYIPMFAPSVAPNVTLGASAAWVNANREPERPLEQLPLERHRMAITGSYAHRFAGSTVRLDERVYDDDWDLKASTTDGRWIFGLGRRFDLWPHVRFHVQSPVSFWKRAYVSDAGPTGIGWNLPEYRTGDRELGPLWTLGGGFGVRWYFGSETEPAAWLLSLTGDTMYTSFLDDLYLTERTAYLGALTMETQW
jgi:hypothetical protein